MSEAGEAGAGLGGGLLVDSAVGFGALPSPPQSLPAPFPRGRLERGCQRLAGCLHFCVVLR